ncbi:terminase large subunit [Eubacteriaceae bacterium ES2]|nr:terminase large subunit [Eubacteriaceae bacterium ES2]
MDRVQELMQQYPDSFLLEYIDKCKHGGMIVGKEIIMMLDILTEHFNDQEITIDFAEGKKRIQFIEEECRHAEAPFAGKPFILELFQKAFIESIYAFYIYDDEVHALVRLYQDVLFLVARKNGKTPLISAICLAEFFVGEKGTKILCSSNDYVQADLAFSSIDAMREQSPKLEKVTRKNVKGIFFGNPKKPKRKGKFSYANKGNILKISAKTGAKEGKNIRVGMFDEVHELKDDSAVMPIRQALSTQDNPLYFELTTEGYVQDGYLDKRLAEARQVLKGELERPRWLIWLFTQDNETEVWTDEEAWKKSNPGLGVIKKYSAIRKLVEEAKVNSATRAALLSKDFNFKQSGGAAWMQQHDILNQATFNIKDFYGSFYISGNDFAETTDLCASTILLKKPNDKTNYFYSHYWIPESKLSNAPDDVDYREWERLGHLTIVPGNSVESSMVADWHFALLEEYDLKPYKSGYDNRFAKDFIARYEELFGEKIAVNVPQDYKVLDNPMRTLEADLRDNLVNYNNSAADFSCMCNTGIKMDTLNRIMPCKMAETKRIDGLAAMVDAYTILEWHRSEFMAIIAA